MAKLRSVLLAGAAAVVLAAGGEKKSGFCPDKLEAVFADTHDGDMKKITIDGHALTIEPSGNDQKWVVHAKLDVETCTATIDFNVTGKPEPPPVNLLATLWWSLGPVTKKTVFEFTDPTGKLAPKDFPLNRWVELKKPAAKPLPGECPVSLHHVFLDMHDGDKMVVDISNSGSTDGTIIMIIDSPTQFPVVASLDPLTCSGSFSWNYGPDLQAFLLHTVSATGGNKTEFEFTDPTSKTPNFPLNNWVQIAGETPTVHV